MPRRRPALACTDDAKYLLHYVNGALLIGCVLLGRWVLRSKFGKLLLALRDREERVRFSGYDVASFKIFIFTLAAMISAVGGAMFTLQVGFMSPSFVGIVPSIEMVVFTAVGGRLSLVGAVYGSLFFRRDAEVLARIEEVAGMSVSERATTAELLERISANRSVIVIEHDMEFVAQLAHRVTVLHQGQVLAEGSMAHVQVDPRVIEVYLGH